MYSHGIVRARNSSWRDISHFKNADDTTVYKPINAAGVRRTLRFSETRNPPRKRNAIGRSWSHSSVANSGGDILNTDHLVDVSFISAPDIADCIDLGKHQLLLGPQREKHKPDLCPACHQSPHPT